MSDDKKGGMGLFINKKFDGGTPSVTPKNVPKRWMYVGVGVLGFSMLAATMFHSDPPPMPTKKQATPTIDTTPKDAGQKAWEVQSQGDIAALKAAVQDLADKNKALSERLEKANAKPAVATLPAGVVAPPAPPGTNLSALPPVMPPSPPSPPPSIAPKLPAGATSSAPSPSSAGVLPSALAEKSSGDVLVFKPEPVKNAKDANLDQVKAKVSYKKNPYSGMLPAGAFASVSLLNGLDAGTASANQANPQPVLLNVTEHATLPGSAKYRLKSCFVLASAYGDLSAERVYFRLAQLSCVDKADRLVMTTPVQGYVVDSDGKLGMRGTVADRQGAKLGKALLAGFAQGLGNAFGSAQGSITSSVLGTATTVTGGDALKQSGLTGASTAASQLAQFYLKEAQNIFPVISVDAGRTGSMVFTQGVPLSWGQGDTQYQKEVKPD